MSKKLIIANWKMNFSVADSRRAAVALAARIKKLPKGVEKDLPHVVLCPSFSAIRVVQEAILSVRGRVHVGAQDCFWNGKGAFTGEESPVFLKELGVEYIIVGHSERRMYLGETDEMVGRKIQSFVLEKSLIPILCVGEKKEERASLIRKRVINRQIISAISAIRDVKPKRPFVIAYEPVWAIGTGNVCTVADWVAINLFIQAVLKSQLGTAYTKKWCRILYGGSVSGKNSKDFVSRGVGDGALVGGASLNASDFYTIIRCAV